jgi:putative ABC transport system permease protein
MDDQIETLQARLLRSQLFGVSAADPVTLGAVVLPIGFFGLVAALIPARRAAAVDPQIPLPFLPLLAHI